MYPLQAGSSSGSPKDLTGSWTDDYVKTVKEKK